MCFKQWVVIEVLVAGKKLVKKHSQAVKRMYTTSMLLIMTLLVNGLQ